MLWSTVLESRVTFRDEISWLLWELIIHYHIHKNLLLMCILDAVFVVPPDFLLYYMLYVIGISMSLKWLHLFSLLYYGMIEA